MKPVVFTVCCLFVVFIMTLNAWADDELEREGIEKCKQLALKMFGASSPDKHKPGILGKPHNLTNYESFVTWRATCAEKPPKGPGNVTALCQGDAVTQSGQQKKVFYWEKISGKTLNIGYYWCE